MTQHNLILDNSFTGNARITQKRVKKTVSKPVFLKRIHIGKGYVT